MKSLRIDPGMKEKWPQTRVGCLQYQVKVEKKNEDMWSYLKKDVFKKTRDAIFDYGVNDIPNIKESRLAYKAFGKDPSRYRVSSEALIRRIGQGKGLYEVNTVASSVIIARSESLVELPIAPSASARTGRQSILISSFPIPLYVSPSLPIRNIS